MNFGETDDRNRWTILNRSEAEEMYRRLSNGAARRRLARRMEGGLLVGLVLLVTAASMWGLLKAMRETTPQTTIPGAPSSGSITLDPPYNREHFTPAGASTHAALTADEAVHRFEAADPEFQLPPNASAELGYYTAAVGDGSFRFKNHLAWGYSWHECAELQHVVGPETHVPCTEWLFLDANTGEMLETAWQH